MQKYPYQDKNLSVSERAEDLLNRMTVQQKIAQLQCFMSIGTELDAKDFPDGLGEANIEIFGMSREQQAEIIDANAKAVAKNAFGIPPIIHTESLTGLVTTVFPSAIGFGAHTL